VVTWVEVLVLRAGGPLWTFLAAGVFRRALRGGASRAPAEIGSEESPIRWLVSWLVTHVMPAVRTIPENAASAHINVLRLTACTLETCG
jgi:hypothetical protein